MLKKFDIFPKAELGDNDYRSETGGFLTIISILFLFWMAVSEVREYKKLNQSESLNLEEKPLPTSFATSLDMIVYNNCTNLHFDSTSLNYKSLIDCDVQKEFIQEENQCHIKIQAVLPNIPASFHIGLGTNIIDSNDHQHMILLVQNKNLSHRINKVRFGGADIVSPLDGTIVRIEKPYPYQFVYQTQLIPVTKDFEVGYQAVASLIKSRVDKLRDKQYAGIYFNWNFFPIGFESKQYQEPIINLVCHLLAIAGSFFVVIRFVDFFAFFLSNSNNHRTGYSILSTGK